MASFSSGCVALSFLLQTSASSRFVSKLLREVYYLNPFIDDDTEELGHAGRARGWQAGDPSRIVRFYTQQSSPTFRANIPTIFGLASLPPEPYVVQTPDGNATLSCYPAVAWQNAVDPSVDVSGGFIHTALAATMVTDAMRRSPDPDDPNNAAKSGFPKR
jgi:hypothetical protein